MSAPDSVAIARLIDGDIIMDEGFVPKDLALPNAHPEVGGVTGHVEAMSVVEDTRRIRRIPSGNAGARMPVAAS